jgi:small-conductance mechanosensitive channel/CRP-like cAMP-binding protein
LINYPTVPRGTEWLRITVTPQRADAAILHLVSSLSLLFGDIGLAQAAYAYWLNKRKRGGPAREALFGCVLVERVARDGSHMIDPLVKLLIATCLITSWELMPRLRMNWPLWLRAVSSAMIFALLTLLLVQMVGTPLRPHFDTTQTGIGSWQKLVETGWWVMAARGATGLMRLLVVLDRRSRETQIITDLVAGAIYIVTALAIADLVFAVSVGGLLATSGIFAIVLGLALQSTLADVFSGIAVGVERPYKAGDLIWVEGGIEGNVTEVTWRSTHIATGQSNIAIVPNSVIAKARLVNRSRPTMTRGDNIEVRLDPRIPPERCVTALTAATRSCQVLLAVPAPEVTCTTLNGDGCVYCVSFFVNSSNRLADVRTKLLTEIHRHLRYNGIALAVVGSVAVPLVTVPSIAELLEQSDLLSVIEPKQRGLLAEHFQTIWLQPGQTLTQEGGEPDALYLIGSGTVEVTVADPTGPRVVHRTSPGECLGAVGLITGSHYAATSTALTLVKAYRLDKIAIAAAIRAQPPLAGALEALAERGQAALRSDPVAREDDKQGRSEMFLAHLRNLIHLLQSR